jgi:hypothetical protein
LVHCGEEDTEEEEEGKRRRRRRRTASVPNRLIRLLPSD